MTSTRARPVTLSTLLAPLAPRVRTRPGRRTPTGGRAGAVAPTAVASPAVAPAPVTLGGVPVRQADGTTCGSLVLLMLAATADPVLAGWLEDGTLPESLPAHRVPPEVPPALTRAGPGGAAARLAAAQQHLKRRTGARALGPLPWPAALGTPPWTAAREARFPGVDYRSLPVDDAAPGAAAVLTSVHGATLAGVPVPLYTGGDLGSGLTTAVPRHIVLAVPPPPGGAHRGHDTAGKPVLHLFEPARGAVHEIRLADLLGRREGHAALGGWAHVVWVLLPVPAGLAPGPRWGQAGRTGAAGEVEEER